MRPNWLFCKIFVISGKKQLKLDRINHFWKILGAGIENFSLLELFLFFLFENVWPKTMLSVEFGWYSPIFRKKFSLINLLYPLLEKLQNANLESKFQPSQFYEFLGYSYHIINTVSLYHCQHFYMFSRLSHRAYAPTLYWQLLPCDCMY